MSKLSVGIWDTDEGYAEALGAYLLEKEGSTMKVHWCSKPENEDKEKVDILLLGPGLLDEGYGDIVLKLVEEPGVLPEEIYKYQSAEEIVRQIFSRKKDGKMTRRAEGDVKLMIFYTPGGSGNQTGAAMKIGEEIGESKKVLYLNFGQCTGWEEEFGETFPRDLSDVILQVQQEEEQLSIREFIYRKGKIDCIPPLFNPYLLPEIREEDCETLYNYLKEKTEYTLLIVDVQVLSPGVLFFLKKCDRVWMIQEEAGGEIRWEESRREHFSRILLMDRETIQEEKMFRKLTMGELENPQKLRQLVEEID